MKIFYRVVAVTVFLSGLAVVGFISVENHARARPVEAATKGKP